MGIEAGSSVGVAVDRARPVRPAVPVRSVGRMRADVTGGLKADLICPVLDCAAAILAAHVPDRDGWCRQCLLQWHRLVPGRLCTQAGWALQVIETHGVEEWDAPRIAQGGQ